MHEHSRPFAAALRLLQPLALVLLATALVLGALGGAALWLLRSEDGTRWLLARLPAVEVDGVRGALLSDTFEAARVRVRWAGGARSVIVTDLRAEGLEWSWHPLPRAWAGLHAARLTAREVIVATGPHTPNPLAMPGTLRLPLRIAADEVRADELRIDALPPFRRIAGRAEIGGAGGHSAVVDAVDWDRLHLSGRARIADARPFAIDGRIAAGPQAESEGWSAVLDATGNLERLALALHLAGREARGRAAPQADARLDWRPFAPWPFGDASARTEALDLSALWTAAPQTAISGHLELRSSAADAPITATAELDNAAAGRWNERRLPVRRLTLKAQGQVRQRDRIAIDEVDLLLGSAAQPAGRWRGSGTWNGHELALDTALAELLPQRTDGRAAAMTLSGPLAFTLRGLPSPDPAAPAAAAPWSLDLHTTLDGRLEERPQPVRLSLELDADATHVALRRLQAQSGDAAARVGASVRRLAGGALQLATEGSLDGFDPLPWWPGEPGSAWRQGPHRLSSDWKLDLRLPPNADRLAPLALLQSLSGSGTLRVHDSQLAGVPVALDLRLGQERGPSGSAHGNVQGELQLAGNRLSIDGQGDPGGSGDNDRWQLALQAPALRALAPLFRLQGDLAPWAPRAGSGQVSLQAFGRWPLLRTSGEAQLKQFEAGEASAGSGSLKWQLDTQGEGAQPLSLHAELTDARFGRQRAEQLRADLSGTLGDHRLRVSGALPLVPPAAAEQWLGIRALSGARTQLQAEGAWRGDGRGGGRWSGHVTRLAAGAWNGLDVVSADGDAPTDWIDARDLSGSVDIGADGGIARLRAAAGRVRFGNAVTLRWDEVDVDLAGPAPLVQLRADVEPFAVAPLLARLQPSLGWGGDLRLAARVDVRAAERFDADIRVERRDGDLSVTDDTGTQALGLSELRLALSAHDGLWTFSPALAGRTLGNLSGSLKVKTTPERRWPDRDATLEGAIAGRVADIGIWTPWVPAGWRLVGEVQTRATIGGRFGAPEYTGSLDGRDIAVRNLLQGVNVSDGQLAVKLEGSSARIERFTLRGGDGRLTLSGDASFDGTPSLRLRADAERFRLLGRIDRQLSASGRADLSLKADALQLDGRFAVDDGLFDTSRSDAPSLDDDVTVRRPGDQPRADEAAAAPRPRRNVAVNVEVDLGDKLRVKGHGLDSALRGKLRITTPGGRLAVNGEVSTDGGTYAAYGQKLDIERGIVAFGGPFDNPRLDILALRPNTDMRVGVLITGTAQNPRARLYSEVDMSETDKLSWMVLGRASDGLGRTDTALLQRAAVALLAGEGEAPTETVMKNLGLTELSVKPSDTDVRETVISLGKQLSRRWYVGYERGVNATTGTWQLIYRIAQRFTLRAQSGQENALDVIWTWKFDDLPLPGAMPQSSKKPP